MELLESALKPGSCLRCYCVAVKGADTERIAAKVESKIKEVQARGINFELSLIYGLPHQTLDSFKTSLDWAHRSGAKKVSAFPLMLLIGTELHARRRELGLVESTTIKSPVTERLQDFIPHVVQTPTMSTTDWLKMGELASAPDPNSAHP